ncbi:hypothetical protein [Rhodohalobacter barkolensis]|uniref:hypothetical protein n=1 Tax=Rhodohalobacter barkolensis TaxID=2053187 RepID=UPI0013FD68EF|nr:hypothetical protein [Rhodohalobacter barkolensis]
MQTVKIQPLGESACERILNRETDSPEDRNFIRINKDHLPWIIAGVATLMMITKRRKKD